MLRRMWQAVVRWFRRLLGLDTPRRLRRRQRIALSSSTAQPDRVEPPQLVDADYEFLFMQLLEGVAHGWPQERVLKFLGDLEGRTTEAQWLAWLRRFGERLLASPAPNNELAARMVRLGELGCGQLGEVAYEIGMQLLLRESRQAPTKQTPTPLPVQETPIQEPEAVEEAQPVTLDELFGMLQQDEGLVQQIADQMGIDTSDPQMLIQALLNKALGVEQPTTEENTAESLFNQGVQQHIQGDLEAAIANYNRSLELDPHIPTVWSNRGVALADLERYEEAIASFERVLQIQPTEYWAWNNRGYGLTELGRYEEAIASFEQGLQYVQPNTYPEGWGQLHRGMGNTYYEQGRVALKPREYWRKAIAEYEQAIQTLTAEEFPEAYLQILQDSIKTHLGLGQTAAAAELWQRGWELLQHLTNEEMQSGRLGTPLTIQFIGFEQLPVDLAIQSGQLVPALELAEKGKNTCFNWFLGDKNNELNSPRWAEMQQLLSPSTAIIYWHLSPASLNTFILKPDAPEPILINAPAPENEEDLPTSVQRLRAFETWVKDWNLQYADYRNLDLIDRPVIETWRDQLTEKLQDLSTLLNTAEILRQVGSTINHLILIPHRSLHRLPLHSLFPDHFTISYLPSAQIGITLKNLEKIAPTVPCPPYLTPLLSVECPNREGAQSLPYAEMEAAGVTEMFNISTQLADNAATKEKLIATLSSGYGIFHFIGHSSDNFKTPKKSALALTSQEQLTLEDISRLSLLNYQLVGLSACETAVTGRQTITPEYVGLVSAFLSRGVSNVLSSFWTVEAASRALFTIEFYRRIKDGVAPSQALKEAQQWLRTVKYRELAQWYQNMADELADSPPGVSEYFRKEAIALQEDTSKMSESQPPFAHPYHWAAFTITGGVSS